LPISINVRTLAEKKMKEETIRQTISAVYDYCHNYHIIEDGIISELQFVEFATLALASYHHGTHEVEYIAGEWELSCYHRYAELSNLTNDEGKALETYDALFYYNGPDQYQDVGDLECDISSFLELFEVMYCEMMGHEGGYE